MPDIVSSDNRSRMMSGIRGANTKPEILVRRVLHSHGLRFRLHRKDLPGKPDVVFVRQRTVIFVNGCFWHAHECSTFKWPKSNPEFWRQKLLGNRERDRRNLIALRDIGWRVIVVWECALRGKREVELKALFEQIVEEIRNPDERKMICHE